MVLFLYLCRTMINPGTVLPEIRMSDYTYTLPDERIAKYPLAHRDDSKLLVCKSTGQPDSIVDANFKELPQWLPQNSLLVFNNTKVVPARMIFAKETGALIEVFCLEPCDPKEYVLSFAQFHTCSWYCVVGNAKRWKEGSICLLNHQNDPEITKLGLVATMEQRERDGFIVRFNWQTDVPFSTVLELCGTIPIPPYLKRQAESSDTERYQTVYAKFRGSVAAPTAGLHFTPAVLDSLQKSGTQIKELTLHVGAGTFKPVKSACINDHIMHSEPFSVTKVFLKELIAHTGPVISVGTTSLRCLESLYYLGLHASKGLKPSFVDQWEPYTSESTLTYKEALQSLVDYLDKTGEEQLWASTQILITPGYTFKAVDLLVTNFHQPNSTLLLLVAAFVGDVWKDIYDHALSGNYRFLSYGDSSLLFKRK